MRRNCTSFRAGSKTKTGAKFISVLLSVTMLLGCFGMFAIADEPEPSAAVTDVRIIRPLNAEFSQVQQKKNGFYYSFALADENGVPIYYENNPIHTGSEYRGVERTRFSDDPEGISTWTITMTGTGKTDDRTPLGGKFDDDFPLSWNYDQLHVAFRFNDDAKYLDGTPYEGDFMAIATAELLFMDHNLVVPVNTIGADNKMVEEYYAEEIFNHTVQLNQEESFSVYFEANADIEYDVAQLVFDNTDIADYADGKITGYKAGETSAVLLLKNDDNTVFSKMFHVKVYAAEEGRESGFRCSKCDWYEKQQEQGGMMAVIARIVHAIIHIIERISSRL